MNIETESSPHSKVPGEPALWLMLIGDMIMFGIMFIVFTSYKYWTPEQLAVFNTGHTTLNPFLGLMNTALLLCSSWFVALAVSAVKSGRPTEGRRQIQAAMVCAAMFVILKCVEYGEHVYHGYFLNTDIFQNFYYSYTAIHLAHVLIGLGVLYYLAYNICSSEEETGRDTRIAFLEGGACYWHLVDVFWIIIFTLFYLAV